MQLLERAKNMHHKNIKLAYNLSNKAKRVCTHVILRDFSRFGWWYCWVWYEDERLGEDTGVALYRSCGCVWRVSQWAEAMCNVP